MPEEKNVREQKDLRLEMAKITWKLLADLGWTMSGCDDREKHLLAVETFLKMLAAIPAFLKQDQGRDPGGDGGADPPEAPERCGRIIIEGATPCAYKINSEKLFQIACLDALAKILNTEGTEKEERS